MSEPALALHAAPARPDTHVPSAADSAAAGRARYADVIPLRRPEASAPPSDPAALCCAIVQAAVEALRGVRPAAQLARWLAPDVFEPFVRRCQIALEHEAVRSTRPARIRRARVTRVHDRAVEATVVVTDVDRVRAAALRLEHRRGSWRVVALELG